MTIKKIKNNSLYIMFLTLVNRLSYLFKTANKGADRPIRSISSQMAQTAFDKEFLEKIQSLATHKNDASHAINPSISPTPSQNLALDFDQVFNNMLIKEFGIQPANDRRATASTHISLDEFTKPLNSTRKIQNYRINMPKRQSGLNPGRRNKLY
ncbi:hypothetical protein V1387_18330 [Allomuricauda taeanensis]|uniref:hypothetical protein n=1 Tax=Flagellimonas taeanensis TaxID=1005926 RepID=UPI002E7B1CCB|nr:hypothetical protein [Allomuricauda taeanensis]MEE1964643.1 hypothetical protein [Allomuricauda taeanensis]